MKYFWLVITFLCFCSSAQAQWYKRVLPALTKKMQFPGVSSSIERKTLYAQNQTQLANRATLKLIRNYHPALGSLDDHLSSAFVIEEQMQGTLRLWGVTVQHYQLTRPAVEHPSLPKAFPIQLQAAGQRRYSDVVLFPLPAPLATQVTALKLARTSPHPGEEVSSYGYYNGEFQQLHHRSIKTVTRARLITSYEFPASVEETGACGGPVLNAQNEVVGVHCGSLANQDNSFAVPVTHIYRLLDAYYHQNKKTEPLFFNGRKIYELTVNQAVSQAVAWQQGREVERIVLHSSSCQLNPAHIEKLFSTAQIDQIVLYVDQTNFTTNKPLPSFKLVYDVKTGKVKTTF